MNKQLRDLLVGCFSGDDLSWSALADYCDEHQLLSEYARRNCGRTNAMEWQSEALRNNATYGREWSLATSLVRECNIVAHRVFVRMTTEGERHFVREGWTPPDLSLSLEDDGDLVVDGNVLVLTDAEGRTRYELWTVPASQKSFVHHHDVYVAVNERPFMLDCDTWAAEGAALLHTEPGRNATDAEILTFLLAGRM